MMAKSELLVAIVFASLALSVHSSNVAFQRKHKEIMMGDPAAKGAADVFAEAMKRDSPFLAKLNAVESINISVQVRNTSDDRPESLKRAEDLEKEMTNMILGLSKRGSESSPMKSSIKTIADIIEKDMKTAILKAHEENQKELDSLFDTLASCSATKGSQLAIAKVQKEKYELESPRHQNCRAGEAQFYMEKGACWKSWKNKKDIKDLACKAYSEVSKKLSDESNNKRIVTKQSGESVESYVKRLSATVCGLGEGGNGGVGKGGFLDEFLKAKEACTQATKTFNEADAKCKDLDNKLVEKRSACNDVQDVMDGASCKFAVEAKDACEAYSECYTSKKTSYDTAEAMVRREEVDRKAEWKGLMRMQCLIEAFKDGRVTDSEVKECKGKSHSTDNLNIKYQVLPALDVCEVPDLYPNTAAYKKKEFLPLPAFAKGKLEGNECMGIASISTTPAEGSPATCKCERVTLNGPYSGGLVKCTNCLEVSRSQDKISCPAGTKLFSPQSRQDWTTFLKSAEPLRAPNWIIDITRPQNGCGGCTGNAMNSDNAKQKSWVTSDGSPWWLRSTTYNEPNGDYHANCYLDLWHNPANADGITFNDGSCSYKSKSYYCQSKPISTTPKAGSPSTCVCSRVELVGEYSAQVLMKCENCLDVRRSNDKNSCPQGTKIFAPASRQAWKTFLASAKPLRDPHWIIDITRPQNGCGGCTKHAMNSGVAAQATWRTADGSPWWLRSTRYNEPNGDYTANCYMDLWHTPATEDGVTFNDNGCSYHSKSYYCQGDGVIKSLAKATTVTTTRGMSCVETGIEKADSVRGTNVAAVYSGAVAFGSGSLNGFCNNMGPGEGNKFGVKGIHCWDNINDGIEGNANSWIPGQAYNGKHFVGIRFASPRKLLGIRLARDGTGALSDRTAGKYKVQYTTVDNANQDTGDSDWCDIGSFTRDTHRHMFFEFSKQVRASAIRIIVSDPSACIDELEVYEDFKPVLVVKIPEDEQTTMKSIDDLSAHCKDGQRLVSIKSPGHVLWLEKQVEEAGVDMDLGRGVPLGFDYKLQNKYQDLSDPSRDVTYIFDDLRANHKYRGDYYTNQVSGEQYMAGFGWGGPGIEDWSFDHRTQAVICETK